MPMPISAEVFSAMGSDRGSYSRASIRGSQASAIAGSAAAQRRSNGTAA